MKMFLLVCTCMLSLTLSICQADTQAMPESTSVSMPRPGYAAILNGTGSWWAVFNNASISSVAKAGAPTQIYTIGATPGTFLRSSSHSLDEHVFAPVVKWGRWVGPGARYDDTPFNWSGGQGLHYAIFQPTRSLPTSVSTSVIYRVVGSTSPTYNSDTASLGRVVSGHAYVNLANLHTSASLSFNLCLPDSNGAFFPTEVHTATVAFPLITLRFDLPKEINYGNDLIALPKTDHFVGSDWFLTLARPGEVLVNDPQARLCRDDRTNCVMRAHGAFAGRDARYLVLSYTLEPVTTPLRAVYLDSLGGLGSKPYLDSVGSGSQITWFTNQNLRPGIFNDASNSTSQGLPMDGFDSRQQDTVSGILILERVPAEQSHSGEDPNSPFVCAAKDFSTGQAGEIGTR